MKRKHRIQATCGQEKQGLSGLQKAPTYKTSYNIIWKIQNAEIPKRNFSLLSNPLILLNL
jgi:hypothetical protein